MLNNANVRPGGYHTRQEQVTTLEAHTVARLCSDTSLCYLSMPAISSNYLVVNCISKTRASFVAQTVKNSACSAGDPGSIPDSGRSPGEGNGNPLLYPCLENPMDRGAWWATVHEAAESD